MRASPGRGVSRPLHTLLGAVLCALVVMLGLTACGGKEAAAPKPAPPTPIAELNTTSMEIPRIEFCELVPAKAIKTALGEKATAKNSWANGDALPVSDSSHIAHEVGCEWSTDTKVTARAWMFALPVDAALAKRVINQGSREKGCQAVAAPPAFGQPTYAQTCKTAAGQQRVRHAGLFGQTWLTCEVSDAATVAPADLSKRAGDWCVAVASSLNTKS